MELTVKNLEPDKIYKFDDDKYVVAHEVTHTRPSRYMLDRNIVYTYVYEFVDGRISKSVYGRIVDKKEPSDINKSFLLVTYDTEEQVEFEINGSLQEIVGEEETMVRGEIMAYHTNPREYLGSKK